MSEAQSVQTGLADSGASGASPDYLEAGGEPTPYTPEMPEFDGVEYCPFYAQYLDDLPDDGDAAESVPFAFDDLGLVDTEKVPIDVGRPRLRLKLGDERLEGAAVPSLVIAAAGLIPVILLCRQMARHRA